MGPVPKRAAGTCLEHFRYDAIPDADRDEIRGRAAAIRSRELEDGDIRKDAQSSCLYRLLGFFGFCQFRRL